MKIKMFRRKYNQGTGSFGPAMGIFAFLLIVSLTILVLPANSGAKDWPTKTITMIVPWTAGGWYRPRSPEPGSQDVQDIGRSGSVVNKPGASGIIGTLEAVKSPPDGYTLLSDFGATSSIQYALVREFALQGGGKDLHSPGYFYPPGFGRPRQFSMENRGRLGEYYPDQPQQHQLRIGRGDGGAGCCHRPIPGRPDGQGCGRLQDPPCHL